MFGPRVRKHIFQTSPEPTGRSSLGSIVVLEDLRGADDEPDIGAWHLLAGVPLVVELASVGHLIANVASALGALVNRVVHSLVIAAESVAVLSLESMAASVVVLELFLGDFAVLLSSRLVELLAVVVLVDLVGDLGRLALFTVDGSHQSSQNSELHISDSFLN